MEQIHKIKRRAVAQACAMVAVLIGAGYTAAPARAGDFSLENGIEGRWTLGASISGSWRTRDADPALLGRAHGGLSVGQNDDGDLNYAKNSVITTITKVNGELTLQKDGLGMVLGAKAWYDEAGKNKHVPHGSFANGYVPGATLDDAGFDTLSKFSGAALDNAYLFGTTELAPNTALSVKVGNHVVNWGESLFIPGINQFGTFDVTAANRPGAQVKEILLPIPQLSATLSLPDGLNFDVFYQFRWKKNVLDGCGTYWSLSDVLNCPGGGVIGGDPRSDQAQYDGVTLVPGQPPFTFRMGRSADDQPRNSGQFGVAARFQVAEIDTDFGVYFANYNARSPIFSLAKTPTAGRSVWSGALAAYGGVPPAQFLWDYSAQDIKVLGVSAATVVAGWSLAGEVARTKDLPVQINTTDMVAGLIKGVGPQARIAALPAGTIAHGYDLKDKTQLQASAVKIFPRLIGAESLTLIGEASYQHWSDIGDPAMSTRYGRATVFGLAQTATIPCAFTGNPNPGNCENKGFATSNAWGYRLQAELSYPDVFAGVGLKPRLFLAQDVKGYSADGTFVEDRRVLGLRLHAEYNKQYYADFNYTRYNGSAKYDVFHDRDNFSVVAGINF